MTAGPELPVVTDAEFVIFINGSYGVGKSSALDHVGDLLARTTQPFSLMDVDWFHRSWPPASADLGNVLIEADNLAAVWSNYRRVGRRQLVVSGVITSLEERRRYATAFGMTVRSVRLEASNAVTEARLRGRYSDAQGHALDWHLDRHVELTGRLRRADLDELTIATDDLAPSEVAERLLRQFALLPPERRE